MLRRWGILGLAPFVWLACGGGEDDDSKPADPTHVAGKGGTTGGTGATTGTSGEAGEAMSRAGTTGAGAASSSGGTTGSGGTKSTGGSTATGGTPSTGGTDTTGGTTSTGGTGGGRQCLSAGSYCRWSNAEDCCSGACDGDSCCGFLGDACPNGFGCCAGNCIDGYCQCPPGTLDCDGNGCVDIEWNENRCGDCNTRCRVHSSDANSPCIC